MTIDIRSATPQDAHALLAIYAPYVERTTVSFEVEPPTVEDFRERMEKALAGWAWLVASEDGRIAGYAYGTSHRERAAYRWSVETSAYLDPAFHRRGVARALYFALFDALRARGYCNAYAGIALPNDASIALHRNVGFEPIGVFRAVGRKFDAWHDVSWWQRRLRDDVLDASPPSGSIGRP